MVKIKQHLPTDKKACITCFIINLTGYGIGIKKSPVINEIFIKK